MTRALARKLLLAPMLSLALAGGSDAQVVHRCIGPEGVSVFSDVPCDVQGLAAKNQPTAPTGSTLDDASGLSLEAETGPVAASEGCPGPDAETLRDVLETAVNEGDLNALTGMYHWASAGRTSANGVISRMQSLIGARPVSVQIVAAEPNDDWLWAGLPPPSEPDTPRLEVRSTGKENSSLAWFPLRPQAGCLWLAER